MRLCTFFGNEFKRLGCVLIGACALIRMNTVPLAFIPTKMSQKKFTSSVVACSVPHLTMYEEWTYPPLSFG